MYFSNQTMAEIHRIKSATLTSTNEYLPYIDGLRGVAIIFVVLAHMGLGRIIPGGFGVSLFFFISGLLITRLLIIESQQNGKISLKKFYLRRIFRLYPALLLMTILAVVILVLFHTRIHFLAILSSLFYFANYYYAYFKPPAINDLDNIFNIAWSLSVEEHFYLVFPILFYFFYKGGSRLLLYLLVIVCGAAFAYRYHLLYYTAEEDAVITLIYVVTETRVDSIIWGCISSLLIHQVQSKWYLNVLHSKWALVIGVAIIFSSVLFSDRIFAEAFRFTRQSLAFMFIVPTIGFLAKGAIIKRIFENFILVFIGKLSYSLYLFHWLAVTMANYFFKFASPTWFVFAIVLSILFSLASYYWVERPFVRFRKKFGSHVR
jgi:peptidoglycan/LPS O-acetylase OafA/YrhL